MVTDVTTVPYNQARYGRSNGYPCAGNVCSNTWNLVSRRHDPVGRRPEGRRPDRRRRSRRTLAKYDIRDRYDFDGDGNFDEPDGYIDRFQIIHAGGDQADGDPIYGEDAIWSHRWNAFQAPTGPDRPGVQPRRRHPDRQHRHLGRRLHRPARERRISRRRPRVRPRPRPARPLRHRGLGRQPGQLVDADGAEPRLRRRATRASAPVPPTSASGTSSSSAGSTTRRSWRARTAPSTSARTSTTRKKAQGVAVVLPDKQIDDLLPTPAEGTKQWCSGDGDDYKADDVARRPGRPGRRAPR